MDLSERLGDRRASAAPAHDPELARLRLGLWRAQHPFEDADCFARRLAFDQVSEEKFQRLLADMPSLPEPRPEWLETLDEAYSRPVDSSLPSPLSGSPDSDVLRAVEPLLRRSEHALRQALRRLSLPFDTDPLPRLLLPGLSRRCFWIFHRTFVLELHVARLESRLEGDDAEERWRTLAASLARGETALALLEEYPVLARQLAETTAAWIDASAELVARLGEDWSRLEETFFHGTSPGPIEEIAPGGDPHRGGRTVSILRFASGLRLVYKPRSLAVDVAFARWLEWLVDRGLEPAPQALSVLDRGTHGWVAHAAAKPCRAMAEIRRFYRRQGALLALLYVLDGTDIHHSNVIAEGEHPRLVDLEALFHPDLAAIAGERPTLPPPPSHRALRASVLRVGLLPWHGLRQGDDGGIDISGLGAAVGQRLAGTYWRLVDVGTDRMRYRRLPATLRAGRHRPTLDGAAVSPADHGDELATGFEQTYRLLLRHRHDLLAPEGPLASFGAAEVRFIPRPTRAYQRLLEASVHPDVLRDALDRDRLFDRLWSGVERLPFLERLIRVERRSLSLGEVPRFTTRAGARYLEDGAGTRIESFFRDTGLDRARRRLSTLDDRDLERQLAVIRGAIDAHARSVGAMPEESLRLPSRVVDRPRPERYLAAALRVGERLATLAFEDDDTACWLGPRILAPGRWNYEPVGPDLYDGLPGIALFLAHLGAHAGEPRFTRLARAAIVAMRRETRASGMPTVGAFSGWGGQVYTLTHLGLSWDDEALLDAAEELAVGMSYDVAAAERYDLVGGLGGWLVALLRLYQARPTVPVLSAALEGGEKIFAGARETGRGIGWRSPSHPEPLTGFAHGAAGITWALARLAATSGEERFRRAAEQGIAYERALFSPARRNWPDLRQGAQDDSEGDPQRFAVAWCHGAPGIGLARADLASILLDPKLDHEVEIAIATTLEQGLSGGLQLCHGALGNFDILLTIGQTLGAFAPEIERLAAGLLEEVEQRLERPGGLLETSRPGLMLGLAGVGYTLLRLAAPHRVPSVLLLELP